MFQSGLTQQCKLATQSPWSDPQRWPCISFLQKFSNVQGLLRWRSRSTFGTCCCRHCRDSSSNLRLGLLQCSVPASLGPASVTSHVSLVSAWGADTFTYRVRLLQPFSGKTHILHGIQLPGWNSGWITSNNWTIRETTFVTSCFSVVCLPFAKCKLHL